MEIELIVTLCQFLLTLVAALSTSSAGRARMIVSRSSYVPSTELVAGDGLAGEMSPNSVTIGSISMSAVQVSAMFDDGEVTCGRRGICIVRIRSREHDATDESRRMSHIS